MMSGCAFDMGASDCEKLETAGNDAIARCGGYMSGHTCDGVIASSGVPVNECLEWFATAPCDDIFAHKKNCKLDLLVSPL